MGGSQESRLRPRNVNSWIQGQGSRTGQVVDALRKSGLVVDKAEAGADNAGAGAGTGKLVGEITEKNVNGHARKD